MKVSIARITGWKLPVLSQHERQCERLCSVIISLRVSVDCKKVLKMSQFPVGINRINELEGRDREKEREKQAGWELVVQPHPPGFQVLLDSWRLGT